jgi:DNA repair protein RadA
MSAKAAKTAAEEKEEDETKVDFEDLDGVGAATAEKLREAGYGDLMELAVASPDDIATAAEVGEGIAQKIILSARKQVKVGGFESGTEILERRKKIGKITTMSKNLDELLGGGVETQSITEVYGQFSSGKSQLAFQIACSVQLPADQGGLDGEAVWIDTENTFRPERLAEMAKGLGLDPAKALTKVHVAHAFNSNHQELLVPKAFELAREKPVRLLIVDSLTAHFRAEYLGRGSLADRQQHLNRHMHDLLRFGDVFNAAILCTNQVSARPDVLFGDPTGPIGGNIVGHTATYRVYLRKSKPPRRIARLVDSPNLPEGEAIYAVLPEGIRDAG